MPLLEKTEFRIKDTSDISHVGNVKDTNPNSRRTLEVVRG